MILKTISDPAVSKLNRQIHEVNVPPLCPKTSNPIHGSVIKISYQPKKDLLEIYSLNEYIASFIGSNEVRDLELFTQVVARDCSQVLKVNVTVVGVFILNIGQTLICECESSCEASPEHNE
jgi:NADPH-dependent 7-cyano-7-deazaguanine reductase QueF